jgi:hypothetical protein
MRRVGGEHAARNEPIEQHADRCLEVSPEILDVGGNMQRLDISELPIRCCSHQPKNRLTATM